MNNGTMIDNDKGFWGKLDKAFDSPNILNAFLGIITFAIVFFFWLTVCFQEAKNITDFWNSITPYVLFGDSFVPSAITYCFGIVVQSIILLKKRELRYFSGIIVTVSLILVQIVIYLVFRGQGITGKWLVVLFYGALPTITAIASISSCGKKGNESLSG